MPEAGFCSVSAAPRESASTVASAPSLVNVETTMTSLPYKIARWVNRDVDEVARMTLPSRARVATDRNGHAVVLFTSDWELEYAQKENDGVVWTAAS